MPSIPKSIRSLNKVIREIPASHEIRPIVEQVIHDRNPRAAAVTSAAFLDGMLQEAICSKLVIHSDRQKRELFDASGPLRGFSAKTSMGCALGLYGPRCHEDMRAIGEIRNAFAHATSRITFQTPEVAVVTRRITLIDRLLSVPSEANGMSSRQRYMHSVRLFTMYLARRDRLTLPSKGLLHFAEIIAE